MSIPGQPFHPSLVDSDGLTKLRQIASRGGGLEPFEKARRLRELSAEAATDANPERGLRLAVAASLLADLQEQGWGLDEFAEQIRIIPPEARAGPEEEIRDAKERHRQSLLKSSNRQLASEGVQTFLSKMERNRVYEGRIVSIASVIDDGAALASEFEQLVGLGDHDRSLKLRKIVQPVVEVCDSDSRCSKTGLRLQDIWRYFRHSWSLEYNPLPGRTLRFLIRNRARPNWPVMGIAMLASPAANLIVRDRWIGWHIDELERAIIERRCDPAIVARSLVKTVKDAIAYIRSDDLLTPTELQAADRAAIFKLRTAMHAGDRQRLKDLQSLECGEADGLIDIRSIGMENVQEADWRRLSGTSLYVHKRAEQLIPLLETAAYFRRHEFERHPATALMEALVSKQGQQAVKTALNELKKRALATEVADVSVCGAVLPYNHLLGGKLVALLMASSDVRQSYRKRYGNQVSEIASQIAGKPITRAADLKVLTTTSLYGIGSSQYNRLMLRSADFGLSSDIKWHELEPTEGFTVTHVSRPTVEYMRKLGIAKFGARRINSVFGEGSSPRTRQIREGLNLIGINNEHVLKHTLKRRVYALELYPGARLALTGFGKAKANRGDPASKIAAAWRDRWLDNRLARPEVLADLRKADAASLAHEFKRRAAQARSEDAFGEVNGQPSLL